MIAAWWGPHGPLIDNDEVASFVAQYPPDFVEFIRGRGAKKVMFGTNYPMISASDCLAGVDDLSLDEETRRLFLAGNATRVFDLDGLGRG